MPNSTPTSPGLNNRLLRLAKAEAVRRRLARLEQRPQTDLSGYRSHPVAFARDILRVDPWERQEEIMRSVAAHPRTTVRSCHNSGKCLGAQERVPLADGRLIRAADLIGQYFAVSAFDKDGTQRVALAYAEDNGVEPVYRVTTSSGRSVVRTGGHPLLTGAASRGRGTTLHRSDRLTPTPLGFRSVNQLVVGDLVAVPDYLAIAGTQGRADDEVKLLGLLLGDGGVTKGVTFTQLEGPAKEEFRGIIDRFGVRCREVDALTLSVTAGRRGGVSSPVLSLIRSWGLLGKKSTQKQFPDWAWTLPPAQLALLLNRLFSCDGWACTRTTSTAMVAEIGIASASEVLIRDVELALLRLGISGRVRARSQTDGTGSGKRFRSWTWTAYSFREVQRFAETVGILGKEEAVERARQCAAAYSPNKTRKWQFLNLPQGYHWEQIAAIEPLGDQPTVALCVPETNTFVTTFVEHNSFLAGCLTHWWLRSYQPSLVITTAPTARQVKDVLWKEIGMRHRGAMLPGALSTMSLTLSVSQRAIGLSTNDPVRFQGWHEQNILVIVDEASGVDEEIYQAVEGILTGPNAKLLLLGNPNHPAGTFYESFRSPLYRRFHIAASDVPARLLPPGWAAERRLAWGEDSVMYQVRVLGQFPPQGDNALVSLAWAEAAQQRELAEGQPCELGVDVAGYGTDESVIYVRKGDKIVDAVSMRKLEPMALVGRISAVARRWQPTLIKVDEVGMGWGIVGALEAAGLPVLGVNVGERAVIAPDEYDNLRTEIFVELAERLRAGEIQIPAEDQLLVDQLTALTYTYTPKGKRKLVSKEDMRKERGMGLSWSSPDRADALALCFAANLGGFTPVVKAGPPREVDRWSEHSRPQGTDLPW